MKLESKEKARARGVPSPDRADALMLAFSKPPQTIEYRPVRELPRLGSSVAEDSDDEDDGEPMSPARV